MRYAIPAVIFAGGRSLRMGEDKTLLPFGGYSTLAEYQYRRFSPLFSQCYLGVKHAKFDFDAPLILDRYPQHSPLAGLISAFESLKSKTLFILPVDVPFLTEEIIENLIARYTGEDAVIARTGGKAQPLCGLYARTLLLAAKAQLARNDHKLGRLLERSETTYVDFEEDERFLNLNRPQEYEEALRLISS